MSGGNKKLETKLWFAKQTFFWELRWVPLFFRIKWWELINQTAPYPNTCEMYQILGMCQLSCLRWMYDNWATIKSLTYSDSLSIINYWLPNDGIKKIIFEDKVSDFPPVREGHVVSDEFTVADVTKQ